MEQTKEINVQELLYAILNKIWLVILAAVVFGMAMYIYTAQFVTPMYQADVTMYVNNSSTLISEGSTIEYITSSDLNTSQRLVATYVNILKSDSFLEDVSDRVYEVTSIRLSAKQIREMMSASSVDETEVLSVSISHDDPQMAAQVANTIAALAPDTLSGIVEGSSTRVIDLAKVPTAPYSPNRLQNTAIGAAAGVVLAVAIIVLKVLMDVRIRGEEDLARISQAPVLGVIPDFDVEEEKGYVYASKKSSEISEVAGK